MALALWQIILIVITIIVILALILISKKKTSDKYLKKARIAHKKGEYYHEDGDSELAEDYYQESEFYRKKAEETENVV